jgi:hypothetical protein
VRRLKGTAPQDSPHGPAAVRSPDIEYFAIAVQSPACGERRVRRSCVPRARVREVGTGSMRCAPDCAVAVPTDANDWDVVVALDLVWRKASITKEEFERHR